MPLHTPQLRDVAREVDPGLFQVERHGEFLERLHSRAAALREVARARIAAVLDVASLPDKPRKALEKGKWWEMMPVFDEADLPYRQPDGWWAAHFRGTLYFDLDSVHESREEVQYMRVALFAAEQCGKILVTRRAGDLAHAGELEMPGGHAGVAGIEEGDCPVPPTDVSHLGTGQREVAEEITVNLPLGSLAPDDRFLLLRNRHAPQGVPLGRGTIVSSWRVCLPAFAQPKADPDEIAEMLWFEPAKLLAEIESVFSGAKKEKFVPHHAYGYLCLLEKFHADACGAGRIAAAKVLLESQGALGSYVVAG